ncbi:MAG: cbb3-type cytochrome oxidase assembly protein CcoS [Rhodobacterales bacterium]|nr:MAG: cbb3-type cytochrome oxidase assembly protein CcoS [Rhodobacterales bacterium]
MNVLVYLIPASLILGGLGLLAFFWTLKSSQYDDPDGDANRILSGKYDKAPPE